MDRYDNFSFSIFIEPHLHTPLKRFLKSLVFSELFNVKLKIARKCPISPPLPYLSKRDGVCEKHEEHQEHVITNSGVLWIYGKKGHIVMPK